MNKSKIIESAILKHQANLGDNEFLFLKRIYGKSLDVYSKRLAQYGFNNYERVLDSGCGFGQWTLALSQLNNHVYSCDISKERVAFVKKISSELAVNNVYPTCQDLTRLSYSNEFFDAVFCYGVLFLTRWRETLRELARVLRPLGKIYLNANGFGWYKHLWYNQPNRALDYDPRLLAAKTLLNTWKYNNGQATEKGIDIIIEPEELETELASLGFSQVDRASEGCLYASDLALAETNAFFKGQYLGDLGVYEVVGTKAGGQVKL